MGSVSVYVRRHHVALVALFFSLSGNAVALQDENTVPSGGIEPSNVQGSALDEADSVDTQAAVLAGISAVAKILADVPPFSREAVSVSGDGASVIALELEGAEGIESTARTPWEEPPSDARLRISRTGPGGGPQHFLITPYEFGMAIEYPGVVEAWVTDFSIHGPGHGQGGARLWVGNDDDTGGILLGARNSGTETWGEIATQKFVGTGHGPLRLRTVKTDDWVEIWSGAADSATRQVMLGTVGPAAAAGIRFGPKGDTNLHRSAADVLKTDGKLITGVGLGVGNSASATTLGSVIKKMEVFDATGASLGYVPIYDAID